MYCTVKLCVNKIFFNCTLCVYCQKCWSESSIHHCEVRLPVRACTLLFSALIRCHKYIILVKVSSSIWYMSLAAQQQPRWRLKVQLQSHFSQVRGPCHWTGIRWRNGEKGKREKQVRHGGHRWDVAANEHARSVHFICVN